MSQPSTPSAASPTESRSQLAAGTKLSGDLSVPGMLELFGEVDGKVTADAIVLEKSGIADGELRADSIAIKGHFKGRVFGGDVTLQSGARVSGEVAYTALTIESGAEVTSTRFNKVQRRK